jgi:hypothetical protein
MMGWTPAAGWRDPEVEPSHIVPFWKVIRSTLRGALASLHNADLAFRPADGLPSIHDLVLHIFTCEDFLIRQTLLGEVNRDWGPFEGWDWRCKIGDLARMVGPRFASVESLVEAMDAVFEATASFVDRLDVRDLPRMHETLGSGDPASQPLVRARARGTPPRSALPPHADARPHASRPLIISPTSTVCLG